MEDIVVYYFADKKYLFNSRVQEIIKGCCDQVTICINIPIVEAFKCIQHNTTSKKIIIIASQNVTDDIEKINFQFEPIFINVFDNKNTLYKKLLHYSYGQSTYITDRLEDLGNILQEVVYQPIIPYIPNEHVYFENGPLVIDHFPKWNTIVTEESQCSLMFYVLKYYSIINKTNLIEKTLKRLINMSPNYNRDNLIHFAQCLLLNQDFAPEMYVNFVNNEISQSGYKWIKHNNLEYRIIGYFDPNYCHLAPVRLVNSSIFSFDTELNEIFFSVEIKAEKNLPKIITCTIGEKIINCKTNDQRCLMFQTNNKCRKQPNTPTTICTISSDEWSPFNIQLKINLIGKQLDVISPIGYYMESCCVICLDHIPTYYFETCKHIVLCQQCVLFYTTNKCPKCRRRSGIKQIQKQLIKYQT
jgi:hypothetical protein